MPGSSSYILFVVYSPAYFLLYQGPGHCGVGVEFVSFLLTEYHRLGNLFFVVSFYLCICVFYLHIYVLMYLMYNHS